MQWQVISGSFSAARHEWLHIRRYWLAPIRPSAADGWRPINKVWDISNFITTVPRERDLLGNKRNSRRRQSVFDTSDSVKAEPGRARLYKKLVKRRRGPWIFQLSVELQVLVHTQDINTEHLKTIKEKTALTDTWPDMADEHLTNRVLSLTQHISQTEAGGEQGHSGHRVRGLELHIRTENTP